VPRALGRLLRAGYWLKVLAWLVFLPGFSALCLWNGLPGPALLLALMGLGLGLRLCFILPGWRRRAPLLVLAGLQVALLVGALWLLGRPVPGGWQRLPGTSDWSDPTLLLTGDGVLVVITSSPKSSFWSDDGGRTFRSHGLPGQFGFVLADDAWRGWVWVGTSQGEHLNMYHRGKAHWRQLARPAGHVWALAFSEDRVFMALGVGGLRVTDDSQRGWRNVPGIDHCTGVAVAPPRGRRGLAGGRPGVSDPPGRPGGGAPQAPSFAHPGVTLGGGGWSYLYEGGMLGSKLAVAAPGGRFEPRPVPARDVRVIVADPEDGRRVWLGSWGQGVYQSLDGGQSWQDLGLQSIEVRSLALDARHGRLFAGSANLLLRRGVYVRTLPLPPSVQSSLDRAAMMCCGAPLTVARDLLDRIVAMLTVLLRG
jgi:hypothetical protein